MIKFGDIMEQYDRENDNELEKIPIISKQIAARLRQHKQMAWTKFPEEFEKCRTEASLKSVAEKFNNWIEEMGLCEGEK